MKYIVNILYVTILNIIIFSNALSQKKFDYCKDSIKKCEVLMDKDSTKMLRGIFHKEQLTEDTAFRWYAENLKYFKPDTAAISSIKANANDLYIIIFAGTWCHDTQNILPKYLSLLEAAGLPEDHLTLFAVDRSKVTIENMQKIFNITAVPTCIVMKDGREVGRIVEYGKTFMVDKELGALVATIQH